MPMPDQAPPPVQLAAAEVAGAPTEQLAEGTSDASQVAPVNTFNRLLTRKGAKLNAPPAEDGIHDPANAGTQSLQWPAEAFQNLPKSSVGNRVDWVKAIEGKLVKPRFDRDDPKAEPNVFELDIVREVKGSMPDVVYPHKQHTEWLDCTNCHDEIFIPEKGKNQISMAAILLGQKCGVCHGKVAFPVSDCRRCHSKPKTPEQLKKMAATGH
jgi:c(7)-type cytochrome triheme protein